MHETMFNDVRIGLFKVAGDSMVTDLFDFSGRVALITGASSGLGVTFAETLAEYGADTVICARRSDLLEKTRQKIKNLGVGCLAVQTDVTEPEQVDTLVKKAMAEYGRIDILVNNAGASFSGSSIADNLDFKAVDRVLGTNLTSAALCAHRVGLQMLKQGYGRIINIASVLGAVGGVPEDYSYAYSISKHGILGLTKALALQWAQKGITANAIGPAYFDTELLKNNINAFDMLAKRTPMGRMGRPEELKTAILFLAAESSSYVTGQMVLVDGGWTVW